MTAKISNAGRFYIVRASDDFFSEDFINKLATKALGVGFEKANLQVFDYSDKSAIPEITAVIEAINTYPFLNPINFIVVKQFGKMKIDDLRQLMPVILDLPEFAYIVMTTNMENKAYEAKTKEFDIPKVNITDLSQWGAYEIKKWMGEYLKEYNKTMVPGLLETIIMESNEDAIFVKNEIDKLFLMAGERVSITEKDYAMIKGSDREYDIWQLVEAVGANDEKKAFMMLDKVCDTTEPVMILGPIFSQFQKIYTYLYFDMVAKEPGKIYSYIRTWPSEVEKIKTRASKFRQTKYDDVLAIIKKADKKIKLSDKKRAKNVLYVMLQEIFLAVKTK